MQAGKLNELVGFLVGSLNNFDSRQQVNDQLKNRSKLCFKRFFTGSKVIYTAIVGNSSVANGSAGKRIC